jgi:hypothetical protein
MHDERHLEQRRDEEPKADELHEGADLGICRQMVDHTGNDRQQHDDQRLDRNPKDERRAPADSTTNLPGQNLPELM